MEIKYQDIVRPMSCVVNSEEIVVDKITQEINGCLLRSSLAAKAYINATDKKEIEKEITVDTNTFNLCLRGMPTHYKLTMERRGFIRAYHQPFWIHHGAGMGKTYQMGIVIINRDNSGEL